MGGLGRGQPPPLLQIASALAVVTKSATNSVDSFHRLTIIVFHSLNNFCEMCVRRLNIRVVVIYLTQRTQRTRSFNSLTAHADAEDVASFTTTGENAEQDDKRI